MRNKGRKLDYNANHSDSEKICSAYASQYVDRGILSRHEADERLKAYFENEIRLLGAQKRVHRNLWFPRIEGAKNHAMLKQAFNQEYETIMHELDNEIMQMENAIECI